MFAIVTITLYGNGSEFTLGDEDIFSYLYKWVTQIFMFYLFCVRLVELDELD